MGVRILSGDDGACMYDSVTDWCFGPKMKDAAVAELFANWLYRVKFKDPRTLTDSQMESAYVDFLSVYTCRQCSDVFQEGLKCWRPKEDNQRFCDFCDFKKKHPDILEGSVPEERRGFEFVPYGQEDDQEVGDED